MFNNEVTSGVGRGRGRGRGRLTVKTEIKNGIWIRGSKPTYDQTTSNANAYQNVKPSFQETGNYRMYQEPEKREEYKRVPPYSSNPSTNMSSLSSSGTEMIPRMSQLQRPRTPPSPVQQSGRGQLIPSASQQQSLLHSLSTPRQSPSKNQTHSRTGSNAPLYSQQVLINNFRQELRKIRSQFNNDVSQKVRSQPNNSFNAAVANNRNAGTSPRRGNKRPVTSSTESNDEKVNTPKSTGPFGPQSKKNKKKKKSDFDSNDSKDNQNKQTSLVNPELYQLKITENKSFTEQAEELIAQLEQTEAEKKIRLEVLKDVEDIFSPYLPQLEPQIYGSTFTNIAFKTSDLDIFLYCPQGQPEYNFVLEKGKLMYKSPKFTNIVRVARARVPVIKATHMKTNVDVDITTMSGQAVYNSQLIKHLLSVDKRLRPLAMLISLWVKLNAITGRSRFTSYSIILMLIYYLQKLNPPILPPLKDILYSNDENSWPIFFKNNKKYLLNENNSNLAELFKGFFEFYINFDFEKVVISPYLGNDIPTINFNKDLNKLTDEFILYKKKLITDITPFQITYTMHVQDPIEHNVNTTKSVFMRLKKLFIRSCERFLNTCQENESNNIWLPLIIKQTPLKLIDEKKINILIKYPVNDENWFENCKQDFKELLKIILINIKENLNDDIPCSKEIHGKSKDIFFAEASYNVFNKKFRFPLRMYTTGIIPLNELKNQFEMIINRVNSQVILFKSKFILEEQNEYGNVKVTIIDKNTTGLNSFLSVVNEFKRYCSKFLTDIIKLRQTLNDTSKQNNNNNILVYDLDVESQERLIINNKPVTVDSLNSEAEVNQIKDDSKSEQILN